eukprot:31182-Pelagococcus_subviridis.AAC.13
MDNMIKKRKRHSEPYLPTTRWGSIPRPARPRARAASGRTSPRSSTRTPRRRAHPRRRAPGPYRPGTSSSIGARRCRRRRRVSVDVGGREGDDG